MIKLIEDVLTFRDCIDVENHDDRSDGANTREKPKRDWLIFLNISQVSSILSSPFSSLLRQFYLLFFPCLSCFSRLLIFCCAWEGEKALTRVKKNANLQGWFKKLADQVCLSP